MSGLLKRLSRLLTVNPEWTSSILPPNSFRVPSPASRLDYVAPARPKDSSTVNYAYFKRDNRRNFESEIAIRPQKALPSGNEYSTMAPTSSLPPRPGRPHHYNKSAHQPPHSGYFPIINCE